MKDIEYADPVCLKTAFPHLGKDTAKRLARLHAKPLTIQQQEDFLRLFRLGYSPQDCCQQAHPCLLLANYMLTFGINKEFAKKVKQTEKARKKQVEATMIRYATGKLKQIKSTYVAKLSRDGEPIFDHATGKQVFFCTKKEITTLPPSKELIQFFLQHKWPQVYGTTTGTSDEMPRSTPEEIAAKLREVIKMKVG